MSWELVKAVGEIAMGPGDTPLFNYVYRAECDLVHDGAPFFGPERGSYEQASSDNDQHKATYGAEHDCGISRRRTDVAIE
jgi:hypothetical protein